MHQNRSSIVPKEKRGEQPGWSPVDAAGAAPPLAAYSHGVEIASGARLVFCSGQLAIGADGAVPEGCEAQTELCFSQIGAILRGAGMTLRDVVRINAFVTDREHMKPYMCVRDRLFGAPFPASTLMIVSGFTREEFVVEIEVIAAAGERA
jgi:2-iminobutanoate/2-iminopropanoate deaminase